MIQLQVNIVIKGMIILIIKSNHSQYTPGRGVGENVQYRSSYTSSTKRLSTASGKCNIMSSMTSDTTTAVIRDLVIHSSLLSGKQTDTALSTVEAASSIPDIGIVV